MRLRHLPVGVFVVGFAFWASACSAGDAAAEPILGRAEPIGLLLVSVDEESEEVDFEGEPVLGRSLVIGRLVVVDSLVEAASSEFASRVETVEITEIDEPPRLGAPVLLASLVHPGFPLRAMSNPVHPDEIRHRLNEVVQLLAESGLKEESQQIQTVAHKIDEEHYPRLLLRQKEAELANLLAEIARLKDTVGQSIRSPEVLLSVKVVDFYHEMPSGSPPLIAPGAESWATIEHLIELGKAKIVAEPRMIVASRGTGRFQTGAQVDESVISQAGGVTRRDSGFTLVATPEIIDESRIRVALSADRNEFNRSNSINEGAEIDHNEIKTTIELSAGEIKVLGGRFNSVQNANTNKTVVSGTVFAIFVDVVPAMLPVPSDENLNLHRSASVVK